MFGVARYKYESPSFNLTVGITLQKIILPVPTLRKIILILIGLSLFVIATIPQYSISFISLASSENLFWPIGSIVRRYSWTVPAFFKIWGTAGKRLNFKSCSCFGRSRSAEN